VAKDWDLPICGHGQRILAPNWTSVVQQVAARVSSFVYRSFHEPVEWFHPARYAAVTLTSSVIISPSSQTKAMPPSRSAASESL